MVAQRDRRRTTTLEAIALHEAVSPDRWCVTKADLKYLKQQVICAIQQGLILSASPTSRSDSDDSTGSEDDVEFGPSIYVVNEQYIKPVTAEAGKMSWALMMNPDGLECDLFVSHAWQEGIFEFLSKVLGSWPFAARSAWCCMLANPQNLNIGSMLQSPKTSPFALALQASRHVLVVPNRHNSVYCRLWCGYEAYVASEKAKIIQIATPPMARSTMTSFCLALIPLVVGLLFGAIAAWRKYDVRSGVIVISLCILMSASTARTCRKLSNYTGLILSGCMSVCWIPLPKTLHFFDLPPHATMIFQAVLWLCCIAFFLIAELDRVQSNEIVKEGEQLRKHYQGSISMAACSQPSDMQSIWEEIGDKVHKVDNAISVLISAGLSSPTLRLAAERGVNIDGAGHAEVAIPAVFLGPQLIVGFSQVVIILGRKNVDAATWPSITLEAIAVFARLGFMFMLYRSQIDERCFMLKVITKLVGTVFFPTILCVAVLVGIHCEDAAEAMSIATFMCFNCSLVLALFFACLGIRGTMCLPGGKYMLQLFLQRGFQCRRAPAPSTITFDADPEDSEDSE